MADKEVFEYLSKIIRNHLNEKNKPIRVAVNGIEGTGKTVFSESLTEFLNLRSFNAIQVSIDGYHNKKAYRYRQGRDSAIGYYEDCYQEEAFVEKVLITSQSKNPNITTSIHDLDSDRTLNSNPINISSSTVIITDGAYLFKPNYRLHWDLKIYLKTDFETAQKRGIQRDIDLLGGYDATKNKYINRYHEASKMYIQKNNPESFADLVIDNTDFNNLKIIKHTANNR